MSSIAISSSLQVTYDEGHLLSDIPQFIAQLKQPASPGLAARTASASFGGSNLYASAFTLGDAVSLSQAAQGAVPPQVNAVGSVDQSVLPNSYSTPNLVNVLA
jgi:hypothetical protein